MEYIHHRREADNIAIANYKKDFEDGTLEELVDFYNRQVRCGIVGVHMQSLYLIALRQEFTERLSESPVYLLDHVLGLAGYIEVVNGHIKILDTKGSGRRR